QMRALFGDETMVVTIQNGLPCWYFQNFSGPHAGYRLKTADPDGVIEQNIESRRLIGCVVYPAGEVVAPGVVKHLEGDRFPLDKRIEGAAKIGKHKTSTLQDVEAGRPVEVDALIGSVIELGELTSTPTPAIRAVHALLRLLVKTMRDEHARVVLQRL